MPKRKQPKPLKPIPTFASEKAEREFWETHDTADYVDWRTGKVGQFPDLKLSTQTISLRLPKQLLANLRYLADSQDVPYQSLLKVYLAERVSREMERESAKAVKKLLPPPNRKATRG